MNWTNLGFYHLSCRLRRVVRENSFQDYANFYCESFSNYNQGFAHSGKPFYLSLISKWYNFLFKNVLKNFAFLWNKVIIFQRLCPMPWSPVVQNAMRSKKELLKKSLNIWWTRGSPTGRDFSRSMIPMVNSRSDLKLKQRKKESISRSLKN